MARSQCMGYGTSFDATRGWLSLDPCGFFGISLSWSVHFFAVTVIPLRLVEGSFLAKLVYYALYLPAFLLAISSLYMAWTTDPGAVPMGARPLVTVVRSNNNNNNNGTTAAITTRRGVRRCHKCLDNFKPPRAHHDSVTGRCVVGMDHYCPWVSNVVGALNHKFFCLFLLYTMTTCLLSLLLLLLRVFRCSWVTGDDDDDNARTLQHEPLRNLESHYVYDDCNDFYASKCVLALFVCSVVFFIFTLSMGCEQLEAIKSGKGKIARMKLRAGHVGSDYERVTEEFNQLFGGTSPHPAWHWFVPIPVQFPRGMKKVILGYEWDESMSGGPYQEDDEDSSDESGSEQEMDELENGHALTTPLTSKSSGPRVSPPQPILPGREPLGVRGSSDLSLHSTSSSNDGLNRRSTSRVTDETPGGNIV